MRSTVEIVSGLISPRRTLAALIVCAHAGVALAQFAPGLSGLNGVFSVPSAGVGEQGRFAVSFAGAYGARADSGGVSSLTLSINPLRKIAVSLGVSFDTRESKNTLRQQFRFGVRYSILDFTEQYWWNAGLELNGNDNRNLLSGGYGLQVGGRALAAFRPWWRTTFMGFVGTTTGGADVLAIKHSAGRMTWGGGTILRLFPALSLLGEISNGFYTDRPDLTVAMAGLRIFPSQDLALTAGYGYSRSLDGSRAPMISAVLTYCTGFMNLVEIGGEEELAVTGVGTPILAPRSDAAHRSAAAIEINAFAPPVQNDRLITSVITLVRPPAGSTLSDVIDSSLILSEASAIIPVADPSKVLQITGTETATSVGKSPRIAERVNLVHLALSTGLPMERILLRDQYSAHRSMELMAFGVFRTSLRKGEFTEAVRIPLKHIAAAMDSISALLTGMTLMQKARIILYCPAVSQTELAAAYTMQDMMYGQSLFKSYAVDITFRRTVGEGDIGIEVAP